MGFGDGSMKATIVQVTNNHNKVVFDLFFWDDEDHCIGHLEVTEIIFGKD